MNRFVSALITVAAVLSTSACGRPEVASEAPVGAVANHATVKVEWDWCVWCKRLESTTLRDAKVASVLQNKMVPLSLDVDGDGKELSNEYQVDGLPTIVVLDAGGQEIGRISGYMPPDSFLERVEGFLQQS